MRIGVCLFLPNIWYISPPPLKLSRVCLKFWKTSRRPVQLTAEMWRGHERSEEEECWEFISFVLFLCVCYLSIHSSLGLFMRSGRFGDRWLECTLKSLERQRAGESRWKWNTAPSTKQSRMIVFTHTHTQKPMTKRDTAAFFFFLLLFTFFKKRTIKYIKTYLQCVCFCFGQKTNKQTNTTTKKKKTCDKLLSCFAGISKVMCPCFLSL